jgi:hypothetical protein
VIVSVHIADVGNAAALRLLGGKSRRSAPPGARYVELTGAVPLSPRILPKPTLGRVGLIAAWASDAAVDDFLARHPLAKQLAHGWHVRLAPTRIFGVWSRLEGLVRDEVPMARDEPAAVLTLGRLRLTQTLRFLKASAAAEGLALREPALLASTALARPPSLVATFSVWQTTEAMRAYARGDADPGHRAATHAHAARPFHHESAFIRFRPYASAGSWDQRDPLASAQVSVG